jgi:hypothetical protein
MKKFYFREFSNTIIYRSDKKYLDVLNDKNRFTFYRFRTSNYRLLIEVGRWTNVERHNRLCQLCQSIMEKKICLNVTYK